MKDERVTETLSCQTLDSIPSIEEISRFPREKRLQIIFSKNITGSRRTIGNNLKDALPDFLVGIHLQEPIITISKLITDVEIESNQDFFEQCARDHRKLARELIFMLAEHLRVEMDAHFPLQTFTPHLRSRQKNSGTVSGWRYYLHGFHCNFIHRKNKPGYRSTTYVWS